MQIQRRYKTAERNKEIYRRYLAGDSLESIASFFLLKPSFVRSVISEQKYRNRATRQEMVLESAFGLKKDLAKFRSIRIGDILQISHEVYNDGGLKANGLLTGTVIYKDNKIVTVQGDYYKESFQLFDLISKLQTHIPV